MMTQGLTDLFTHYKNVILLGEAGSGKSEISINLAEHLAENFPDQDVHLFDMDQTKPLFRLRDIADAERTEKFCVYYQKQIMDSPTAVGGVEEAILNLEKRVILDVGGGEQGARLIGQYAHPLQMTDTIALYLINTFRPWSGNRKNLMETMEEIEKGSGLNKFCFVANPNLGPDTTYQDIIDGYQRICDRLQIGPIFICVMEEYVDKVQSVLKVPVLSVRPAMHTARVEAMK